MGLRQTINEKPALAGVVSAGIVILAIIIIVWQMSGSGKTNPVVDRAPVKQDYFTVDDGKTYFADDLSKVPPFMHEGKEADTAFVFKCGNGAPFVAYMRRATKQGRKQANIFGRAGRVSPTSVAVFEFKKPGKTSPWIPMDTEHVKAVNAIIAVKCPNGEGNANPVFP